MKTYAKVCSLHPGGVFKSSWVQRAALTYELGVTARPLIGALFAGTLKEHLDMSLNTARGVILLGTGTERPKPWQQLWDAEETDQATLDSFWRDPEAADLVTAEVGLGSVLLSEFTPVSICAVVQNSASYTHCPLLPEEAKRMLREYGVRSVDEVYEPEWGAWS